MHNTSLDIFAAFSKAFTKAVNMNHAVALWAEPGCNNFNFLIDQNPSTQTEKVIWNSTTKGFLLHPFLNEVQEASILLKPSLHVQLESISKTEEETLSTYADSSSPYKALTSITFSESDKEESDYTSKVEHLLEEIKTGSIKKIVLARHKDVSVELEKNPVSLALELRNLYPNAFIAVVFHPLVGCWIGASPELLASIDEKGEFNTIALAGTQTYDKHKSLKEHRWTNKEIEEQALVTRFIVNCFKAIRLREYEEEGPKNYLSGNLIHLCTRYKIDTKALQINNLVDQLLPLLHPTSATCGEPKAKALTLIKQYEKVPRQLYTGYWGALNLSEKSAVYVNLRCAQLYANGYRAYAGAGITADSIPSQEWLETEHKLNSIEKILYQFHI